MPRRPGLKPLPDQIKIARGQTRPSRLHLDAPVPPRIAPERPADLSEEAARVWDAIVAAAPNGLLTAYDSLTLEATCRVAAEHRRVWALLEQSAPIIRGRRDGLIVSPVSRLARALSADLRAWLAELGMSPASRVTLRGGQQDAFDSLQATLGPPPRFKAIAGGRDRP